VRLALVGASLAACVSPTLDETPEPGPAVCARDTLPIASATQVEVAATPLGATMVWTTPAGVMVQRLDMNARAVGDAVLAWPGTYERATIATLGDQVIIAAVSGDVTWMLSAPLGLPPYRELAILGGIVGESPIVNAGGQHLAASVSYGGMQVTAFDASWTPLTSVQSVLTGDAHEVAAASVGTSAIVAWPSQSTCNIARLFDAAAGESWLEPGRCDAPHIATAVETTAVETTALVFEREGGIYLTRQLSPSTALRIADGRAPHIVAVADRYWLSYIGSDGTLVAGDADQVAAVAEQIASGDGTLARGEDPLAVIGPTEAHELAVIGGIPRAFITGPTSLTVASLCAN